MIVPYQTFDTADRPICLAPGNDRLWARCAHGAGPARVGDRSEASPRARSASRNKAELLPMIAEVLKQQAARALAGGAGDGRRALRGGERHRRAGRRREQIAASKLMQQLPGGGPKVVGLPIAFDHVRPHSPRSAPTLGEHTDEVLGSLPK